MTLLVRIAVVFVSITAGSLATTNGTGSPSDQYKFCGWNRLDWIDLDTTLFLEFNRAETQCVFSPFCSISATTLNSASCTNNDFGSSYPSWGCKSRFSGSGYSVKNHTVDCPDYSASETCVRKSLCKFKYTPMESPPVGTYVGGSVGGVFSLIVFGAIIYWCCRRRNARINTTTTTIIRTQPAPQPTPCPPPPPAVSQTNVTVNLTGPPAAYPAQQHAAPAYPPPAYAAPAYPHQGYAAPAYPPQGYAAPACPAPGYGAPAPPPAFNPHYNPEPSKQGYY